MTPLIENLLIGLGTGLISGLVTGYYSGLIITRRSRFDTLLADLQRHLNSIDYMNEMDGKSSVDRGTSKQIIYVGSELAHFGHKGSAELVWEINRSMSDSLYKAECVLGSTNELASAIDQARKKARTISPSRKIYLPWGRT